MKPHRKQNAEQTSDLSRRKQAEEQIKNLSKFPSENPYPVLRLTKDGTVLYANAASESLLGEWGVKRGEVAPEYWHKLVGKTLRSNQIEKNIELEHESRILSFTIVPIAEAEYVNLYGLDITERKHSEHEIENLAKFPSQNPYPVLRIGADGTVIYANAAGLPLLDDWNTKVGQAASDSWGRLAADMLSTNELRRGIELEHRSRILSFTAIPIADAAYVNFYGLDVTENRRAEEERMRAKALSDALNNISAAMSSTLVFDEIMQKVTKESVEAIDCESGAIIMHEDNFWIPKYVFGGLTENILGQKLTGDKARPLELAAQTKRSINVNDALNDPRADRDWMKQLGIKSFLVSPLKIREEVIGVIVFHYRSAATAFNSAQIDFAEKLAASLSLAIQNMRSHEITKQSLADTEALRRMSAHFTETLELDDILETGLNEVATVFNVKHGVIYVFDETGNLVIKHQRELSPEFLEARTTVPASGGCAGEAIRTKEVFAPSKEQHEFTCEYAKKLLGLDCLTAIPIMAKGNVIGVLELFAPVHRRLSDRERRIGMTMVDQLAGAIENAGLYSKERNIAETLQQMLLTMPEKIEGIDFSHLYRSATVEAGKVGGDFYDVFELEHDKVGLVIGDVSGKGLEAATVTALVKNTIKAYVYQYSSPAKVIELTNDVVIRAAAQSAFVTLFLGILDKRSGALTYCNAGHPPPILKREASGASPLRTSGPVIGALQGLEYDDFQETLQSGDILFLYTDGLIEARCEKKLYGEDRLIKSINDQWSRQTKELPELILKEVWDYSGCRLTDDTAILSVSIGEK